MFLISLKAGGFGLNLTEADYCILLDPWWNPATEAQAVDRVHRIGQTRKVMVYRLVAKDTIEEKVMALKAKKSALFANVMDAGGLRVGGADRRRHTRPAGLNPPARDSEYRRGRLRLGSGGWGASDWGVVPPPTGSSGTVGRPEPRGGDGAGGDDP